MAVAGWLAVAGRCGEWRREGFHNLQGRVSGRGSQGAGVLGSSGGLRARGLVPAVIRDCQVLAAIQSRKYAARDAAQSRPGVGSADRVLVSPLSPAPPTLHTCQHRAAATAASLSVSAVRSGLPCSAALPLPTGLDDDKIMPDGAVVSKQIFTE